MRRAWLLIALAVLTLPAIASSAAPPPCTQVGTDRSDDMYGDGGRDVLCSRGGQDYLNGRSGADEGRAGAGSDTLVGGGGLDRLKGLGGSDELFGVDGALDLLDGGKGDDRCYGDTVDVMEHCEHKVRVADA
jgi:hypothetical protein